MPETPTVTLDFDVNEFLRDQVARRRAGAEPLPGPLADAFSGPPRTAAGFTFRRVCAGDYALLRELDSPLYRRSLDAAEHRQKIRGGEIPENTPMPETKFSEYELAEMIFLFTLPGRDCRRLLNAGRDVFREAATQAILDRISISDFPELIQAVLANFDREFSTAVAYRNPKKEGEEEVFPKPPAGPAMGSAGGCTTSAA